MIFSSTSFLLLFLPLSLASYFITPQKYRAYTLCLISILFYLFNDPTLFWGLCLLILITYGCMKVRSDKTHFIVSISFLLFIMAYFKYYGWLLETLQIGDPQLIFSPLGYSFIIFSMLSCVIDAYRHPNLKLNFFTYFNYILFFPKIFMGPLMRYEDFQSQWNTHPTTIEQLYQGSILLVKGCFMKAVFANTFAHVFSLCDAQSSMLAAWLCLLAYGLQLYFDFNGYTCMAQGIALFFGFKLPENFKHPYVATSIQNFWTRWHISLSTWFKDYVYIPLGGNRHGRNKTIRNLLIVWGLTGIWHGNSLPYLLWGLYHASLLLLERYWLQDILAKIPLFLRRLSTFILVLIGWIAFFQPTMHDCLAFIQQLFHFSHLYDSSTLSLCTQYGLILFIGLLFVTYLPANISKWLHQQCGDAFIWIESAVSISMWIIIFAYLIADSYQAFLYFQF